MSCYRMLIPRATISKFLAVEVGRDDEQPWSLKICGSCGWCGGWCLPSWLVLGNFPLKWPFPLVWLAKKAFLPLVSLLELLD